MSIGKRIKHQRNKKKLTQTELAKMINVSSQVISNWEREYTSPDYSDLHLLSTALETTADYLLSGEEVIPKESEDIKRWIKFGKELKEDGYNLSQIESMVEFIIKSISKE